MVHLCWYDLFVPQIDAVRLLRRGLGNSQHRCKMINTSVRCTCWNAFAVQSAAWRLLQGNLEWRTMLCGLGSSEQCGDGGCGWVVEDECGRQVLPGRACKLVAELKGAWHHSASGAFLHFGMLVMALAGRANLVSQVQLVRAACWDQQDHSTC